MVKTVRYSKKKMVCWQSLPCQNLGSKQNTLMVSIVIKNCKVFEEKIGVLAIATMPKFRIKTKYINGKYCHLEQGMISINVVSTEDQIADCVEKASGGK